MHDHLRRALRIALWVAGVCLLAFLVFVVVGLMQEAPSKATAQRLAIAQTVTGCLSAAAALTATGLAMRQGHSPDTRVPVALAPKLLREDELINRSAEMGDLVARIEDRRVVSCHGPRGAGKSFLLEHLADVVNGHRPAAPGQPKPKRVSAALYFDLADAAGFAEVEAQICRTVLGDPDGTWADFVSFVKHNFKRRRVVLILDNVNSPGLWLHLGKAAYHYSASRPNDKLVFGSIEPVALGNLDVQPVPVLGLDLHATKELVATRGVQLSCDALVELHGDCMGLPLYVRLLTAYGDERSGLGTAVIDDQLIPELPSDGRRLLSYAALIALIERRISIGDLQRCCPLADLEEQLAIIENRTLIAPIPDDGDACGAEALPAGGQRARGESSGPCAWPPAAARPSRVLEATTGARALRSE